MEICQIQRRPDEFQQSVTADQIQAMTLRALGASVRAVSATELGNGMYNNTYRVDIGERRPVVLRVAPEPDRQFRIERELMRNEHASSPFFASLTNLVPRMLAADFTHEVIGRDYLFQSCLAGVPGPDGIGRYDRSQWPVFFRQLGEITRAVHDVRGKRFGSVANPSFDRWSDAVAAYFDDLTADLDGCGLDSSDMTTVANLAREQAALLDEITEPRLLHGDLWTVNVMMAEDAPEPTICGVFDNDRTSWGDPESDWSIYMAAKKPGTERDAFWESYGSRPHTAGSARRSLFYLAKQIGAIRLERHRLSNSEAIPETYEQMLDVIEALNG